MLPQAALWIAISMASRFVSNWQGEWGKEDTQ